MVVAPAQTQPVQIRRRPGRSIEREVTNLMKENGSGKLISATRIVVRPEKRKELFLTISSLLESIRHEEGCQAYRFYGEAGAEDSFMLFSEWQSRGDWDRHLKSEHFTILLGSLEVLSTDATFDFKLLSEVEAVNLLSAARAN
jgi:quinol monooxygenase YgiN